ncbi:MAG: hypothetical protein ACYTBP_13775 [Planctomycetota bacterium]
MIEQEKSVPKPGVCIPWEQQRRLIQNITGDEEQIRRIWEDIDSLGYVYIWQVLLSF